MLYSSSNYAFGSFSNNPQLNYLTTDPRQYARTYFMPNEQDKMVTHLRRWIHKKAGGGVRWGAAAATQPLPSRLSNAEAFDVFHAHTKHCTHCSGALKNVIRLRNTALILAAIFTGSLKSSMMILFSSIFFVGVAFSLEKLRRSFFVYDFSHQDNN